MRGEKRPEKESSRKNGKKKKWKEGVLEEEGGRGGERKTKAEKKRKNRGRIRIRIRRRRRR
jgi:hypothetical protein